MPTHGILIARHVDGTGKTFHAGVGVTITEGGVAKFSNHSPSVAIDAISSLPCRGSGGRVWLCIDSTGDAVPHATCAHRAVERRKVGPNTKWVTEPCIARPFAIWVCVDEFKEVFIRWENNEGES